MVTETGFTPVFDYSSVFKYDSIIPPPKSVNRKYSKSAFTYHSLNIDTDADAENTKGEDYTFSVLRNGITFALYLLVIITFPLSFWICIKKVHALERIVLMRLGKLQPIRGPGFTVILPGIDSWTRVDLRPQTFTVSTPQLLTADGGIVEAISQIEYQVSDVTSYVMKLSKQETTLKDLGLHCLNNIISEKDQEDLENNREFICCAIKDELNRSSLKWGLEILNVYLHSVKILKAAEPVNALGTLMNALKAATGQSSEHTAAIFPLIPDGSEDKSSTGILDNAYSLEQANVLSTFKSIISAAEHEGLLTDVTGNFKFDIVGNSTNTVFCSFDNGQATVTNDLNCELRPDVSLILTEDNLRDFVKGKVSPLEAYMEGKVMVTGDWSLLRPLAKIFEKPLHL